MDYSKLEEIKVYSVQVMVPYEKCINRCKFCISRMNCISINNSKIEFSEELRRIYKRNLALLYERGCNNIVITGDNEPVMNMDFLRNFSQILKQLNVSFGNIEIQTTGVLLDNAILYFLKNRLHINILSLSIASLDEKVNADMIGRSKDFRFDFRDISYRIHEKLIKLRITILLTDWFDKYENVPQKLFDDIIDIFIPEQITIKVLRNFDKQSSEGKWISNHSASDTTVSNIMSFLLKQECIDLVCDEMPIYNYKQTHIMFDGDCMKAQSNSGYRYLILMPDGELRDGWI